jgi:hypothetical protein
MARCQRHDLVAAAVDERLACHNQRARSPLNEGAP